MEYLLQDMKRTYQLLKLKCKLIGCKLVTTCKPIIPGQCVNCKDRIAKEFYPELTPLQITKIIRILTQYDKITITKNTYEWSNVVGNSLNDFLYNVIITHEKLRPDIRKILGG